MKKFLVIVVLALALGACTNRGKVDYSGCPKVLGQPVITFCAGVPAK